jgi:hypothetical protein
LKSLLLLWNSLALESARQVGASATRDIETVASRSKHEGLSFLTITLPAFGKELEKALDQGQVDSNQFSSFRRTGGLPRFLSGFLCRIFDRNSGVLLENPCVQSIRCVRQLTLMFAKIDLPCSNAREKAAFQSYLECEKEMKELDANWDPSLLDEFHDVSSLLFSSLFAEVDSKVYHGQIRPKHGPGSTADGLLGNQKYTLSEWTRRMERYFPSWEFLSPHWRYYQEDAIRLLEPGAERPVKVISVPKTQKTPRIIAMEPTAMQYAQQGIMEAIREHVEGSDYLRPFLDVRKQEPNQVLAKQGSLCGDLATLDLSEASDRVSNQLVKTLLRRQPHLREAVEATRSRRAVVPGHAGVIRLSKFASMGSALCFPVEAMVFLTVIFMAIQRELRTSLSRGTIRSFHGKVRVYGDDIIVPVEYAPTVASLLETFGFRVNTSKSFWTGQFRESCGREYYAGSDVSIVRVRRLFAQQRQNAPAIISMVELRNQLYHAGYWDTVEWLDSKIEKVLPYFPHVEPSSPVLGRHTVKGWSNELQPHRRVSVTQTPLVKGFVVAARSPVNAIDGPAALLKWFLKRGDLPFADRDHLWRSGRPKSVNIRLGWHRPF